MKFNALKLVFYTLVVHVIVPESPNKITAVFGCPTNSSKLNKTVNDFRTNYNLKKGAEYITQNQGDNFGNVSKELIAFEIDLLLILQQITYVFNKNNETGLIYKDYILTICLLLPRCLNFIYINVFLNSITAMLSEIHIILCHKLPTYYMKNITAPTDDIEKERFVKEIDRDLTYIRSLVEEKTKISNNLFDQTNYKNDSKNFILNVYNIIDKIKLTRCMRNKLINIKLQNFKHYSITKEMKLKVPLINPRDSIMQNYDDAKKSFLELNNYYTFDFKKHCNLSTYEIMSEDLSTPKALQEILFFILIRLQKHITNNFLKDKKILSQTTGKDLEVTNNITVMLHNICQKISLILVFLKENNVNDDSIIYSTYFTFCVDYKGYTDNCCTSAFHGTEVVKSFEAEKNDCIRESVKNIWTWNIFITTTEVPSRNKNKYINKEICISLYMDYLREIHNAIKQFYTGKTMGVWTRFEWLSGKYFLTENSENVNLNELKSKNITVRDVTMSLSVAYHAILPWDLNMLTVMEFHKTIVYHLERTMNTYVYRYAQIIFMYLKRTGGSVGFRVLQNIRDSVRWYTEGTELFYKYLYLPLYTNRYAQNEPQPTNRMVSLISIIKNIDNNGSIKVDELIPSDEQKDFSQWSETRLPDIDDGYKQFNNVINRNCMDAMNYVSAFFSIAKKSMDINFEFHSAATMYSQYCPQNIFSLF
ncbi:Hypothetical protein CINCED_3A019601 [Cinara cedri]|uniref:Uncharacterized protein n=1 Tax=Cinara cedri TaxID=506608 RepID=A0A5E4M334_9HEMI|nr:Hypothetical protein CINCED_3A019601 [Cinara cedri]